MKRLSRQTRKIKNFINEDIWKLELEEFSKARARFLKYLKILLITIRTFSAEKIGFQAVALSFFSTMSVVPFIAIVFAITGGLGLADKLQELLYGYFENSTQIIDFVINAARNIIDSTEGGGMGAISGLLFAWIVVWMMLSVERVFNNVWKVTTNRNIFKRLSYIIAMLLIAPFVIMVFLDYWVASAPITARHYRFFSSIAFITASTRLSSGGWLYSRITLRRDGERFEKFSFASFLKAVIIASP